LHAIELFFAFYKFILTLSCHVPPNRKSPKAVYGLRGRKPKPVSL
jgi:hypothetical protein